MADKDFKVKTGLDLPAPLPILEGGTGQTTANNALNAMLPSQTTHASKILGTDGTNTTWVNPGAAYQTSAPNNPVTGQLWVDSDETGDSLDPYIIRRKTITATAGQTVFTTDVVFTDGYEQIYYNGVLLVRTTDYTTNGGTNTVTLLQGASAGDTVEIISYTPINLVNAVVTGAANTITAATTTTVPLTIAGLTSQTANLIDIKNSAGEIRHEFRPNGSYLSRGTAADQSSIAIERYDNADAPAVLSLRSYGGTISTPAIAFQDTRIGLLAAEAYDGTALRASSRITFTVDGPVIAGNIPGRITFNTVPVGGGGTHVERMRITSAGSVGIGTSTPTATRLHVVGTGNNIMTIENSGTTGMDIASYGLGFSMIGPSGAWKSISFQPTGSGDGIGLAVDTTNKLAGIYGYLNGSAVYPIHFNSSGNVGIGTTSPTSRLHINGSTTTNVPLLRISQTNAPATFNWSASMINGVMTAGTNNIIIIGQEESARNCGYVGYRYVGPNSTQNAMTFGLFALDNVVNIDGNGNLLVGYVTSNGAFRLQVNSQIFATSSSISTSDGRYKEEVDTITNGLSIVDSLRPVSFKWKEHPVHNFVAGKTVGFIAQEVQEALADYDWADNIIKSNYNEETEEEFLGIAEANIIPLLVSAVKELKAEFEEYKRLHP